jgi:hypothetical protein
MTIGQIKGYTFRLIGDEIAVEGNGYDFRHRVPNYGTSLDDLTKKRGFSVGWTRTDDFETLCFYDKLDGNFGYCLNVTWNEGEWTYMYFGEG